MPEPFENKWKVFFLVGTSIFMSTLDSSIVNVALPFIMKNLHTDMVTIQWVVMIYLMTVSSMLLTFGRLSDIQGRKRVYIAGFATFTLGSFFCGIAPGATVLIISRAIQGLGASMLMACSPALVVDAFPQEERGRALGMLGATVAAGLTTGPVLGGMILEYFSWRFIFYINIPIGLAAIIGGLAVLGSPSFSKGSREPLDRAGSILLVIAISSLVVWMGRLPQWGLVSWKGAGLAGVCLLSTAALVVSESRSRYPLFDMPLLRIRLFVFPLVSAAILFAGLFVIIFMMPFYLTYPCGFSASKTGMVMIVPFLFLLFVSPAAGMLYDRLASRRLCMAGMTAMAASHFFLLFLDPSMNLFSILWRIGLAGLGTALFVSPNNTAILSAVPLSRRGIASGAVATSRNLGMVIGVALAGLVFSTSFSSFAKGAGLENYSVEMQSFFMASFRRTMMVGMALSVTGIVMAFLRGKEDR